MSSFRIVVFSRAVRASLEVQLDPRNPIASQKGFVHVHCTSISKDTYSHL